MAYCIKIYKAAQALRAIVYPHARSARFGLHVQHLLTDDCIFYCGCTVPAEH